MKGIARIRTRLAWLCRSEVCANEDGVALILVMVMLVMLTFIGLAALSTSSTELFLSANYRRTREAFNTAEGLMEESLIDNTNFVLPAGGAGTQSALAAGTLTDTDPSNQQSVSAQGTVTFTATGPAPAGSGMGTKVKANYFIVDVIGTGSLGSVSRQELDMSKIIPGG